MIRFYILFLLLFSLILPAEAFSIPKEPEPIFPLTKVIKPLEYYQEQAQAWQTIVQQLSISWISHISPVNWQRLSNYWMVLV